MRKKILVTYRIPEEGLLELRKHFEVYYPEKLKISFEELNEIIQDYDGVMAVFGNTFPKVQQITQPQIRKLYFNAPVILFNGTT